MLFKVIEFKSIFLEIQGNKFMAIFVHKLGIRDLTFIIGGAGGVKIGAEGLWKISRARGGGSMKNLESKRGGLGKKKYDEAAGGRVYEKELEYDGGQKFSSAPSAHLPKQYL